jgi:hypothetical protein
LEGTKEQSKIDFLIYQWERDSGECDYDVWTHILESARQVWWLIETLNEKLACFKENGWIKGIKEDYQLQGTLEKIF